MEPPPSPPPVPVPTVAPTPPQPASMHSMWLRSHVRPPQALNATVVITEPTSFSQANKVMEWRKAMAEEFNALLRIDTWSLVPRTTQMNLIGNKWVYRIKQKADGSLERYKTRLVAKGFHQQHGLDYGETFSPVVKPTTIRCVLSIAVSNGWPIR
ncbi:uncharacterized mitochondrial protein AtMg00820-like [Telopea speciosissima]|uniref:uncharacterized mitochondrial protein AtMg00820-like n=1 Tax=Telopea speciosissima TaxID=54955 RepID=UPI001CC43BA1|nr:uncharacterized mitochondrial protein AtMg00820-like [Telopea speciosissima]